MHLFAAIGLMPVLAALSTGGGVPAPNPYLTEAEFLAGLGAESVAVVSNAGLPLARAELLAMETLENPTLQFAREDPEGPNAETVWSLSWQLPERFRRLEIEAAEKNIAAAAATDKSRVRDWHSVQRRDFARWAIAAAKIRVLESAAARFETLTEREKMRVEKGESSQLAASRLELATQSLHARLALFVAERERARAEVVRWLPSLPLEILPELPALASEPGICDECAAESTTLHPLEEASRAELEAAELRWRATGKILRSPELTLGWKREQSESIETNSGPVLGLRWSVPIFDRRRADQARALARLETARARATWTSQELSARRVAYFSNYQSLYRQVVAAEEAQSSYADMLNAAERSFRYGEMPLTELLEVQRQITDSQLAALDLYAAALKAHRELEKLMGPQTEARPTASDRAIPPTDRHPRQSPLEK